MIIRAGHPNLDEPNSYLTASVAAAATALTVANNAGFAADDYFVIGKVAQEGAELHKVSSVASNVTISCVGDALKFAASINTEVTKIQYNKVRFYLGDWSARYTTGTITATKDSKTITGSGTSWGSITTAYALLLNGRWYDIASVDSTTQITLVDSYQEETFAGASYALVGFTSQATVDIAIDQTETIWDDVDALAEDYYRTDFYNSTSTNYSSKSSIISAAEPAGYTEFSLRALEDEVLDELQDPEAIRRTRTEIDRDLNNAQRELLNAVIASVKEDYLNTMQYMNLTTNGEETLPDDFRKMKAIWVSYDGSTYNKAAPMRIDEDYPEAQYQEGYPQYYIRDNVVGVKPIPSTSVTNGLRLWFERRVPSLKNEGDEVPYLLRDFKRAYIDYALEKACMADDKKKSVGYGLAFKQAKQDLIDTLKDRDESATRSVDIVQDQDMFM